jgi:FtsP/CotA-like multicopper oxidase with cupredoxin domain
MNDGFFELDRRRLLAGLGGGVFGALAVRPLSAASSQPLELQAVADSIALNQPNPSVAWRLAAPASIVRARRGGGTLDLTVTSRLPAPAGLAFRGPTPAPELEPPVSLAPGSTIRFSLPLRGAGTGFLDLGQLADGAATPARRLPVIIDETEPSSVDRDEVFLIEDWRVRADGTALGPGTDPKDATVVYTVNGQTLPDLAVRARERVRLRFINGCQRAIVAVKIAAAEGRVMAIDSQPAEPFPARNGAVVLPPGGRADVFIDLPDTARTPLPVLLHDGATARPVARLMPADAPPIRTSPLPPAPPLPSNGLPDRLDLKGALRADLALDGPDWAASSAFSISSAPAFQAKAGRCVVLALANRASTAGVFHLHGHHFRLLDRLDDGWKPYWLDTLALEPGTIQRIAFAAETAGRFLLESMTTDWAAPRRLRWYAIN